MAKKRKKVSKGVNYARSQYSLLTGNTNERKRAYDNIKNSLSFPELCEAIDYLNKNLHNYFKSPLWGNPLPKSYESLGVCEELPYLSENFAAEINWTLINIRKHHNKINIFILYKEYYEQNLLTGNYEEADRYLTKIENEVCFSIWTLENRFIINELEKSSLYNKKFLLYFNEKNKSKGFIKYLAHFLSQRAEKSLSVNRYNSELHASLEKVEGRLRLENINYYKFKLSFLNQLNFSHYNAILNFDFQHSAVDTYLNTIKVLTSLLTLSNYFESDDFDQSSVRNYVLNRINYLIRKINDPILYKLKLFSSNKLFPAFDIENSKLEISIIDKYTLGLYDEVEEELSKLLLKKPNQFDLYTIYVKALIYQKKNFKIVGNKNSIQNEILNNMYNIISTNISPKLSGINLLRIANNIASCELSFGIIDFVFFQTEGKNERKLFAKLSYNCANPIIHEIYPDKISKQNYLDLLIKKFPQSITIDFFDSKLKGIENLKRFEKKIPEAKYKVEYAKKLQEIEEYKKSSEIWKYLVENYQDTTPILEIALKNLFICYEKLNYLDECIKLYVNSFFQNSFIIEKIETDSILSTIKKGKFRGVQKTIDLAIFYTLVCKNENEIHVTLEQFNISLGVKKPSELLPRLEEFDKQKIIFYLRYTCSPHILRNSPFITGSKEKLEERLVIVQFLRDIDNNEKELYEDEIKNIQNILIIQKGLIELDESKIYVNEQGIIKNELVDYEAVFQRFKTISNLVDTRSKIFMLDLKGKSIATINYTTDQKKNINIEYSANPTFDIYLDLFNAIKQKFLYSPFGIVAYLSTRIRHGVLIGEIRPVFEKHKLITLKEKNSTNYRINTHWDNTYKYERIEVKVEIQSILKDFSSKVDGLIFDLIKKYLQVYSVDNKEGWFNYDFDENDLWLYSFLSINSKKFDEFALQIFEILWDRTDKNLELIRKKIRIDIAKKLNDLFSDLERSIANILTKQEREFIVKAIKDCSTEVQTVIGRVSSWFKRSGTATSDFQLSNLIDIVMEYANKSNPNKKIKLTRTIEFDSKIKGEYLTHFADILRIFIENILKHSSDVNLISAEITTKIIDQLLCIEIENEVSNKQGLESLKNVWNGNTINIEKLYSEGKSGYHKAYKILTSDLNCNPSNCLITSINEDESKFLVSLSIRLEKLLA